jgi:hypothetical protein
MTTPKNELSDREIHEPELTIEDLKDVSAGSMSDIGAAGEALARSRAEGVVRVGGR